MRLTDLNPRWYAHGDSPDIVGITFDCPCCGGKTRIGVRAVPATDRESIRRTSDAYRAKYAKSGSLNAMLRQAVLDTTLRLEPAELTPSTSTTRG